MVCSIRKFVQELAHQYQLISKCSGKRMKRHCILQKTDRTKLPSDWKSVDEILARAESFMVQQHKSSKNSNNSRKNSRSNKAKDGFIVGANVKPLDETNLGNIMLQKLGWSPGEGLGRESSGNTKFITAVVRKERSGLGIVNKRES